MSGTTGRPPPQQRRRSLWSRFNQKARNVLIIVALLVVAGIILWGNRESIPPIPGLTGDSISPASFSVPNPPPQGAPPIPPGGQQVATGQGGPPMPNQEAAQAPRRRRSVTFATTTSPTTTQAAQAGSGGASGASREGGSEGQGTRITWADHNMPGRRAGAPIDMTFVMEPGQYTLVLDSAVSSERAGPFTAHFKEAVRSPMGVRLIEAGTRINGTYQSDVGEGQGRINAVIGCGTTYPQPGIGIPFCLGAPAGGPDGSNGMPGHVDNKAWPKLRNAAFLMMTQTASQAVQAGLSAALQRGNGTSINVNTGTIDSALSQAIQQAGRVQSVVTKNRGEEVTILLTEPVIFDRSYFLGVR